MTSPALMCHHLTVTGILTEISAVFSAGEFVLVTGDTGAGKTTLLQVMACLRRPCSGQVVYGKDPVSRWAPWHQERWRRNVGIVFQTPMLLEDFTVTENVLVPLIPRGMTTAAMSDRASASLHRLDLSTMADTPVSRLSAGERQRVSIARALVADPAVILADEPTAHQDDHQAAGIMALMASCARDRNALVIMTAHDPRIFSNPAISATYRISGGCMDPSA